MTEQTEQQQQDPRDTELRGLEVALAAAEKERADSRAALKTHRSEETKRALDAAVRNVQAIRIERDRLAAQLGRAQGEMLRVPAAPAAEAPAETTSATKA